MATEAHGKHGLFTANFCVFRGFSGYYHDFDSTTCHSALNWICARPGGAGRRGLSGDSWSGSADGINRPHRGSHRL